MIYVTSILLVRRIILTMNILSSLLTVAHPTCSLSSKSCKIVRSPLPHIAATQFSAPPGFCTSLASRVNLPLGQNELPCVLVCIWTLPV